MLYFNILNKLSRFILNRDESSRCDDRESRLEAHRNNDRCARVLKFCAVINGKNAK